MVSRLLDGYIDRCNETICNAPALLALSAPVLPLLVREEAVSTGPGRMGTEDVLRERVNALEAQLTTERAKVRESVGIVSSSAEERGRPLSAARH